MSSTEQTDTAKALVSAVTRAFYEDIHVCVVDFLLRTKFLRDGKNIGKPLHIKTKAMRETLTFLQKEHIVSKETVYGITEKYFPSRATPYRRHEKATFWYIDLNRAVHTIRLRLHLLRANLEADMHAAVTTSHYKCPGYSTKVCNGYYTEMEVQYFPFDETSKSFLCRFCHEHQQHNPNPPPISSYALSLVDNSEDLKNTENKLRRLKTQMTASEGLRVGIYDMLQRLQQLSQKSGGFPVTSNLPSENGAEEHIAPPDNDTSVFAEEVSVELSGLISVRGMDGKPLYLEIEATTSQHAFEWAGRGGHSPLEVMTGGSAKKKEPPPLLGLAERPSKMTCRQATPWFLKDNHTLEDTGKSNDPTSTEERMRRLSIGETAPVNMTRDDEPACYDSKEADRLTQKPIVLGRDWGALPARENIVSDKSRLQQLLAVLRQEQQQCRQQRMKRSNSFPPRNMFLSADRESAFASVDWESCADSMVSETGSLWEFWESLDLMKSKDLFALVPGNSATDTPPLIPDLVPGTYATGANAQLIVAPIMASRDSPIFASIDLRSLDNSVDAVMSQWNSPYNSTHGGNEVFQKSKMPADPTLSTNTSTLYEKYRNALEAPHKSATPATNPKEADPAPKVATQKKSTPKKKGTGRRVQPAVKVFVNPTKEDILSGRGTKSNLWPGNVRYREAVEEAKPVYLATKAKREKTRLSRQLVEKLLAEGRRFLQQDKETKDYYLMADSATREKVSQALRDDTTPQKRAERRKKYGR